MALIVGGGYFLDIINQVNIHTEKTAHCIHLLTYEITLSNAYDQNWEIFEQFYSNQSSNFKKW